MTGDDEVPALPRGGSISALLRITGALSEVGAASWSQSTAKSSRSLSRLVDEVALRQGDGWPAEEVQVQKAEACQLTLA